MFVQVVVVLLAVALAKLVVILDNIVHLIPDILVVAQRIVRQIGVHKDFRVKVGIDSLVRVDADCAVLKRFVALAEIVHGVFYGVKNMLLLLALRVGVPRQCVLQAPQLRVRVPPEGVDRTLGQKQVRVVDQFLPERVQIQVMFRVQTKQLDRVGIAGEEQRDHFRKTVDGGIGLRVDVLLKAGQSDQVGFPVQGDAPHVDVAVFIVGAVGVAPGKPQQDHVSAKVFVGLQEAVGFGF